MFDRISNGFALARSSWGVLLKDKHLLVFPFVSGMLFLIVLVSFAVPLALLVDWNQVGNQAQNTEGHPENLALHGLSVTRLRNGASRHLAIRFQLR